MKHITARLLACTLLSGACAFSANATEPASEMSGTPPASTARPHAAPPRYKTRLPAPVELEYRIDARQRGISLDGSAFVRWHHAGSNFSVETETRARLFGKIMDARTEGTVGDFGLAPLSFREKRLGKTPTVTTFDREAKVIRFSASEASYPIAGGEQDRSSIVWQLIAVARAAPARFKPGSEWHFFVAGQRDADPWTFKVLGTQRLQTALGELETVQVARLPPDGKGQQLDLWLAPKRDWLPVRLRFADDNGDFVDQTLHRINRGK